MRLDQRLPVSVLLVSGLLAGCAPTAGNGSSSTAPQVLKTLVTPVEMKLGETRYVQVNYPRQALKLGDSQFDKLNIDFSNMSGNNVNSAEAYANWLTLQKPKLPRGVTVTLDKAFIAKDVDRTYQNSGGTEVYYYEVFRLTYKIVVAPDAPAYDNYLELPLTDGAKKDNALLYLKIGRGAVRTG